MATATDSTTVEKVIVDALETFGAERADISRDATFEQIDVDSLDLAELSQVVDEEFGVTLKSSDVEQLKTVGDAVDLIVARAS
jgi:acyl carrier protein